MKSVLIGAGIFLLIAFLGLSWYKITYSMDTSPTYEINAPDMPAKVLIATQGSAYKDTVVKGVIAFLSSQPVYIKVTDVSALAGIDPEAWTAIMILHTWEMYEPPEEVKAFIDCCYNAEKMIILTTSGDGNNKMEEVDAITSASEIRNAPQDIDMIEGRIQQILTNQLNHEKITTNHEGDQ